MTPRSDVDTTGKQPYQSGLLSRITAIHFPEKVGVAEQGLLKAGGVAIALDTGDTFPGMSTGASGRLIGSQIFTVLTPGMVVFGQPQHGDTCFMACTDGRTILRGHQDVGGDMGGIVWDAVYTAPNFSALSFAGGAFFVVQWGSGRRDSSCAVSFDGENFNEIGNIYPGLPDMSVHDELSPGSVAFNGHSYATAGPFQTDPNYPNIISLNDFNMAWASSAEGTSWNAGVTPSETSDPGANPFYLSNGGYTSIAGGTGIFVAAATKRTSFQSTFPVPGADLGQFVIYVQSTAAAAISSDGNSWTATPLPGAIEGLYLDNGSGSYTELAYSISLSIAFVRTSGSAGYFVITANGGTQTSAGFFPQSWCWKGSGSSWQMVKQANDTSLTVVSAIARDLSSTKIVYV